MPQNAALAARGRSASGKTILGDLPPSSSESRFKLLSPEAFNSARAVRMLPVKAILSTSMWRASASPAVWPKPVTTLTTPSGTPASKQYSASLKVVIGVSSEGLITIEQPVASAGATFQAASSIGEFQGV